MRLQRLRALRGLQPPSAPTSSIFWTCSSCRYRYAQGRRWNSSTGSSTAQTKPYYITTPIFYVNAAPHIGHLYTMVLTDVLKRWQKVQGKQAFLCTGTDEHGMKIQQAAKRAELNPKEFCDNNSQKFRALAEASNISNDFFIRTTDDEHKRAVEHFWLHLKHGLPENMELYEGNHEGWYCVSDECFYPEDMVRLSLHHQTGEKIMINIETENEVEWIKEKTWFFPLSKHKEALLKFYEENPDWIQPRHRMNEVKEWVENHLEDLSITRPASRLSWGIADPEDAGQTIYVWVDALINYLTKSGYGSKWTSLNGSEDQGLWPADVQVIGKDILRFHAVYWPALLMAAGLPLPKKLLCHNHWTMSNRKMSKSIGNVVDPHFAMERWDVDPLRYFLMRNGSLSKDMDYSNELIGSVYEKELRANLGNLLFRVARPKSTLSWSTSEAVKAYRDGECEGMVMPSGWDAQRVSALVPHLNSAGPRFAEKMNDLDLAGAVRVLFELLRETNRFISDVEPWKLAKIRHADAKRVLNWIIFQCSEALRIAGILYQPIMPTKASLVLDELAVKPESRVFECASMGKDVEYGVGRPQEKLYPLKKFETLFPPAGDLDVPNNELSQQVNAAFRWTSPNKLNRMSALLAREAAKGEEETSQWMKGKLERATASNKAGGHKAL